MSKVLDQQLCDIFLRMGCVHQEQLDEAIGLQKIKPKRVWELLIDLGYIEEDHLLEAQSELYDIPFEKSIKEVLDPSLTTKVPISFIREYQMVPFRKNGSAFYVAVHDPANLLPLDDLRIVLGGEVRPVLCRQADIQAVIDGYFDQQGASASEMIETIALEGGDDDVYSFDQESNRDLLDLANEAPIIKLINLMISGAIRERASDIHIEPFERQVVCRYRVDGVLYEKFQTPKAQQAAVVSRIKIMARLNIAEHRLPQDGRIKILLSGKEIDIRVSIIPVQHGERVVMRILEKGSFLLNLEQIGMGRRDYGTVGKIIKSSHGIVLVTGPTGSGKSTTLYACLERLKQEFGNTINVITVEDPVEYQMAGVGQIEVRPRIGLTFASALRSILRQDPDVILVGEIRDQETADMAVHASLTGHLVFSTLHTNDSAGAVTRLVNMGIEPFLVTSSTIAILAQRLVRRICQQCREPVTADPEALRDLGPINEEYVGKPVYVGRGCDACQQRGYLGRTGIFELLAMTPNIQDLVLNGADSNAIKREAVKQGMYTLRHDGTLKVFAGTSTIEEVLRVTREDQVEQAIVD
ncbi:MAG: type II secretion system ATPase GspE [Candidatus Hydrogenedentota bacterium]